MVIRVRGTASRRIAAAMACQLLLSLIFLFHTAVGQTGEWQADSEAVRQDVSTEYSPQACPTCTRQSVTCKYCSCAKACPSAGGVGKAYDPIIFDFHYKHAHCFEQFAFDGLSMLQDFDVYCGGGKRAEKVIDCDNMHLYCARGVSLLAGCRDSESLAEVVDETCGWVCKNKRPVLRCKYQFDPTGFLGYKPWGVESCALMGTCTATREERIDITCKPRVGHVKGADTSDLMHEIESLQKSIQQAQGLYSEAQALIAQQQLALASYELQAGTDVESAVDSALHNNITQAQLQLAAAQVPNGSLGHKVMESVARDKLCDANGIIQHSSRMTQLQCFKACSDKDDCKYFAEWNHSARGDETSSDCLLYRSCEDYEMLDNQSDNVTNQSLVWRVQAASPYNSVLATQLAIQFQLEDANSKLKVANLNLVEEMSKVEEEVDVLQEENMLWKYGLAVAAFSCLLTACGWGVYACHARRAALYWKRMSQQAAFKEGAEPEVVNVTVHTPDCDGQTAVVGRPVFLPQGKNQELAHGYIGQGDSGRTESEKQKRRLSDLKAELRQQGRQSLRSSDRESEAESWQQRKQSIGSSRSPSESELWQKKKHSLRSGSSASHDRRRSRDTQDSSRPRPSADFLASWEEQFADMDLGIDVQEKDSDSSETSGNEAQRSSRRASSMSGGSRYSPAQRSSRRPSSTEVSSRRTSSTSRSTEVSSRRTSSTSRSSQRTPNQRRTSTSDDSRRQPKGTQSNPTRTRRSLQDEELSIVGSRRPSMSSSNTDHSSMSKPSRRRQRSSPPAQASDRRHSGLSKASSLNSQLSKY